MHTVETQFGGRRLAFETGRLAQQADGAVVVTYGDAVILGTVVMSDRLREGIDYFPLSVDYEERSYSIGKIPGSVFRREGRPHWPASWPPGSPTARCGRSFPRACATRCRSS